VLYVTVMYNQLGLVVSLRANARVAFDEEWRHEGPKALPDGYRDTKV
jgi:hypothetical protein